MSEQVNGDQVTPLGSRKITKEERRKHYLAWKKSGLNQVEFCNKNQLALPAFQYWVTQFRKIETTSFAPVMAQAKPSTSHTQMVQVEIRLPNQA